MSKTYHDRVGRALELLRSGLKPYVEREMKARYGAAWLDEALKSLGREPEIDTRSGDAHLDVHGLLVIMWHQWQEVFGRTLGHGERSLVSELRGVRNRWAHQEPFTSDDAHRAVDSMMRLLTAISAPEARKLDSMREELLRVRFEEQARRRVRSAAALPTEGQPAAGLKPWRDVVNPHPDVASGRYRLAEFAANLDQVHRGEGAPEYRLPREFFHRTFLTDGLRRLLQNAVERLSATGGDPVVELQTTFGGGKTHSLLALYHLFSGSPPSELPGVEGLLAEAGVTGLPEVRRAVLVGTVLNPAQPVPKDDGTEVHTMWGELAWQLGGRVGFELVAQADASGVSPGTDALRQVLTRFGPCLVLIDEWVAFVRQLYTVHDLPAGSFDANLTFVQTLTEAACQVPNALVVAGLPESRMEVGGEAGREALQRIKHIFARVESCWRPASAEEGFEIVRRRLFQPIDDYVDRDAVIRAFMKLYHDVSQEFPQSCAEGDYRRRLESAYPIHPELFDALYGAWASVDKFQRTRGVLRLMAIVIHVLWERGDSSLLIMPGTIPIHDEGVRRELKRLLDDAWDSVIGRDVDGPQSLPLTTDGSTPNLGRYSACRRVARTIFMGTAPLEGAANLGIDERRIKLGCVQPGENPAIFGDALRRLTDQATYIYVDRDRHWVSTQPNVTRTAQERAANLDIYNVHSDIVRRLRVEKKVDDFAGVHAAPEDSDVPDDDVVRLVILGPECQRDKGEADKSRAAALNILKNHRSGPRFRRNMLVFLAPDRARLIDDLEPAVRRYLAWKSIASDREALNLNASQANQATSKLAQADEEANVRVGETFVWLLVPVLAPGEHDKGEIQWEEMRLQGNETLAARAARRLLNDEHLMTRFAATRLRLELDRHLWPKLDHVPLEAVWEALTRYLYLSRLRDKEVLRLAVEDGISRLTWGDTFAYADDWDQERGRYIGLKAGRVGQVIIDRRSLLVKPEAAHRQFEAEAASAAAAAGGELPGGAGTGPAGGAVRPGAPGVPGESLPLGPTPPKRFHGSVDLTDPLRISGDVGTIAQEVIQHLAGLVGAKVTITLEIEARVPNGVPDGVVRTVSENCHTLKFRDQGFEPE
jgi:hypothetical protein